VLLVWPLLLLLCDQSDLNESVSELKTANELLKKSAADNSSLLEQLRHEQDRNKDLEKQRKLHETQLKELQVWLSESHVWWLQVWHSELAYMCADLQLDRSESQVRWIADMASQLHVR